MINKIKNLLKFIFVKNFAFTIGSLLTIFGIWYTIYYNSPRLRYTSMTQLYVSKNNLDGVSQSINIELGGKKYNDLYITTVEIENIGGTALGGEDISPVDPIRIVVSKEIIPILPFKNITTSKDVQLKLIQKNKDMVLNFNYLNPDSKIVVSFFHENFLNEGSIKIIGSAKNLGKIKEKMSSRTELQLKLFAWGVLMAFIELILCYIWVNNQMSILKKANKQLNDMLNIDIPRVKKEILEVKEKLSKEQNKTKQLIKKLEKVS